MINSRLANAASAYTQSYAPYNLRPRLPSVFRSIISDNFGHTRDYLFRGQWVYDACLREENETKKCKFKFFFNILKTAAPQNVTQHA